MSGLIVGLVIRTPISDEFVSTAKYVAIIYADHAWEDGTHAYPAVETVASLMGLDVRTVQRHLRVLENIGMLVPDGKGPRGTNKYRFPLIEGTDGSVRLALIRGDAVPPRQIAGGDTDSGDTDSGDTGVTRLNQPSDIVVIKAGDGNLLKVYEQEIGVLTPMIVDEIRDAEKTYPPEWIPEAIAIAVSNNARNWRYVEAVLKNCKAAGKRPSLNRLEKKNGNISGNSRTRKNKSAGGAGSGGEQTANDPEAAARHRERWKQLRKLKVPTVQ